MSLFSLFGKNNLARGLAEYEAEANAVLLDVRTKEEYFERRIPGSRNVPVDEIGRVKFVVPDVTTPVYLYCRTGNRSSQAANIMKKLGYTNVKNIGGIQGYRGRTEGGPR
ncbi:MAG: rhodanese-like domain-containing protein [Ruminiclostridium sp.]|nr:rhodanese-like domain-containing protein [Ruminiclostridium sp.]